jgi:hypothetical protein
VETWKCIRRRKRGRRGRERAGPLFFNVNSGDIEVQKKKKGKEKGKSWLTSFI